MSHHDIHVGDVIKYPEMVIARTVNFLNFKDFSLLFPKNFFFYQTGILLSTEGWVSNWYVGLAKNTFA